MFTWIGKRVKALEEQNEQMARRMDAAEKEMASLNAMLLKSLDTADRVKTEKTAQQLLSEWFNGADTGEMANGQATKTR